MVAPHIIIRVRISSIGAVETMIAGILGHIFHTLLLALLKRRISGCGWLISRGVEVKRGLVKEKRGSTSVKAASQGLILPGCSCDGEEHSN